MNKLYWVLMVLFFVSRVFAEVSEQKNEKEDSPLIKFLGEDYAMFDIQFRTGAAIISDFSHPKEWGVVPKSPKNQMPTDRQRPASLEGESGSIIACFIDFGFRPINILRLSYSVSLPISGNDEYKEGILRDDAINTEAWAYSFLKVTDINILHGPKIGLVFSPTSKPFDLDQGCVLEVGCSLIFGQITLRSGWEHWAYEETFRKSKIDVCGIGPYIRGNFNLNPSFQLGLGYGLNLMEAEYSEGKESFLLHEVTFNLIVTF